MLTNKEIAEIGQKHEGKEVNFEASAPKGVHDDIGALIKHIKEVEKWGGRDVIMALALRIQGVERAIDGLEIGVNTNKGCSYRNEAAIEEINKKKEAKGIYG